MTDYYSSEKTWTSNSYMKYRAKLTITTSSTNTAVTIKWKAAVQMQQASGYGVGIKVSGADSGSDTGYLTSASDSWTTVASTSGTLTVNRTTSSQSKTFTAKAYGTTVSGHSGAGSSSVSISHTVNIAALESYTIKYNANGGSGAPSSQTKYYGKTLTLSSTKPTRTGYTFLGWSTSSSATSATWSAGGSYTTNASDTLYAVWKINTYSVTYNANGGTGTTSAQTKTYGTALTLRANGFSRTGYTFQGWATSASGAVAYAAGASYTANAAIALYAVWKINTWTVSYNANGGSGAPSAQTKTYGTSLTLSSVQPTRTGYSFLRWNTASGGGGTNYSPGATYTGNAALALYAQWQINTYVISYNANGGSGAPSAGTKTYGTAYTLPNTVPTRSGYNFKGWAQSSTATTATYQPGDSYTSNAATTFFAVWEVAYKAPTVSNVLVVRSDNTGIEDDEGEYAHCTFDWEIDSTHADTPHIKVESKSRTSGASWVTLYDADQSGTSGSFAQTLAPSLGFSKQVTYDIRITVSDSEGQTQVNTFLSAAFFTMDFRAGGHGIAVGAPSTEDNFLMAMDMKALDSNGIKVPILTDGKLSVDLIYPIGAIYMSVNSTDPGLLFGGTWQPIEDTFLLAAGSNHAAGSTGGAETVTLTAAQSGLPAHTHGFTQPTVNGGADSGAITGGSHHHSVSYRSVYSGGSNYTALTTGSTETGTNSAAIKDSTHTHNLPAHTHSVSGGAVGAVTGGAKAATSAHDNMPPYLAVYVWKRIT